MIVAADTGGTFTDLAAYDRDSGRLVYTKSLTTYGDLVDGVMDCVRKAGIDLGRDAARDVYGHVLDDTGQVLTEETTRRRSELAQVSGKARM